MTEQNSISTPTTSKMIKMVAILKLLATPKLHMNKIKHILFLIL